MELYIANIKNTRLDRIDEISAERRQRAEQLKMTDDKKRCITAGLMEKSFLHGAAISRNKFGKPQADNGIYFNLSHSGDYVLLALADSDVGCDIQKLKYVKAQKLAKIVFCANEIDYLHSSEDKMTAFYELWTKKESLLKCIGEGFHRRSKSIDVTGVRFSEHDVEYYFKTFRFSDYIVSVCSKSQDFPKSVRYIDFS